MPDPLPQMTRATLRSDARENRDRVLESARELFAERGLDVTMREIARRAEVGPATLYRRFPTKQALVDEAFGHELRACRAIVQEGAADPDPWRGFCSVVRRVGELNARNHGFVDAFLSAHPGATDFTAHRAELLGMLADLCRRAQQAGAMRPDVVLDDLVLVIMAGRGLTATSDRVRLAAARRFSALAVEGFRAGGASGPLPPVARVAGSLLR
ncbi:MAG TPA: helix-turn-helix domain-containing protein [Cellulomonas sp.]